MGLRTSAAKNRQISYRAACAVAIAFALTAGAHADQTTASTAKKKLPASKTSTVHHKRRASAGGAKTSSPTHSTSSAKRYSRKKKTARARGQQKIDSERAQAIQEALIRQHYLSGEATREWNQESEEAMRRYQADNGWQSKTVPDSRALIKLGLGPSKDHLLNPDSAMTTVPDTPKAAALPTTSNSAPAVSNSVSPASAASSNPQ